MRKTPIPEKGTIRPKGKASRPEYAGEQNMNWEVIRKMKNGVNNPSEEKKAVMAGLTTMLKDRTEEIKQKKIYCMKEHRKDYDGQWTEETLSKCIEDFFDWTVDKGIVPSAPLLALWLGTTKSTITGWKKRDDWRGEVIGRAFLLMEALHYNELDRTPVPNMFRLKTGFGYVEASRLDINNERVGGQIDIDAAIEQLGLDNIVKKSDTVITDDKQESVNK